MILGGLMPVMFSGQAGADVMKHSAAPLLGAMVSAPLFSLLVIPAIYSLRQARALKAARSKIG